LQLVEVDAGKANDVISTNERQGFCLQFMEAETVHESKQGCEWQSPEGQLFLTQYKILIPERSRKNADHMPCALQTCFAPAAAC